MAVLIVPTDFGLAAFSVQADLDGQTYDFRFQYNDRAGFWYFDLYNGQGEALRHGVKVVSNYPFLRTFTGSGAPSGAVFAINTSGRDADPSLDDLGALVRLAYADEAEVSGG